MLNNHKKLIVFDLNLDWKQDLEQKESNKDREIILSLMKRAYDFQTVVLTTSGCFFDALDFVLKNKIDKGYLVANGGAIIYDIANKKVISEHFLQNSDVRALFHHGYTMGLNIIFATKINKYIYVSNSILYEKMKRKAYSPYTIINQYNKLNEILSSNEILDLSYTSHYDSGVELIDSLQLYNVERFYDNEVMNFIPKVNKSSVFIHFGSKQSTKYKAILAVMAYANIDSPKDVLYIASTCFNRDCYLGFKNTLVSTNPNILLELEKGKKHNFIQEKWKQLDEKFGLETDNFWK